MAYNPILDQQFLLSRYDLYHKLMEDRHNSDKTSLYLLKQQLQKFSPVLSDTLNHDNAWRNNFVKEQYINLTSYIAFFETRIKIYENLNGFKMSLEQFIVFEKESKLPFPVLFSGIDGNNLVNFYPNK
jgi:hypothetical protein